MGEKEIEEKVVKWEKRNRELRKLGIGKENQETMGKGEKESGWEETKVAWLRAGKALARSFPRNSF